MPADVKLNRHLRADAVAGIPGAIVSIPDGMSAGLLAGVSPVHGLYASLAGRMVGGLTVGTRRMIIATTSASALAAAAAIDDLPPSDREAALYLVTAAAGVAMLAAGALRLGRYTRFVTHSVMIGFLTGIALNIICSQAPGLVGVTADGAFPLAKAFDVLAHPSRIDQPSLLVGLGALALLAMASRTPLKVAGALLALAVPSVAVAVLDLDVATVHDLGDVPSGLPVPSLPELSLLSPALLTAALAVAAIVLVQGAAVAETAPDPGRHPDLDRDFLAHGAANVASGLLTGTPVGGSVSETTLNVSSGARTRWASILSAAWLAAILLLFSGLVGRVAMPTLAAVLIMAGISALRPYEVATILRTGQSGQIATLVTFVATVVLTVPAAVGVGVAVSLAMQLNRAAIDLRVVRLVPGPGGGWVERPAPTVLTSGEVLVLDVYGSLFFAGARTLQTLLPVVGDAQRPAVVLRLRGRTWLGVTSFIVLGDYAQQLATRGGRLYLSGVDPALADQIRESRRLDLSGPVQLFGAEAQLGASTTEAYEAATTWELRPAASSGEGAVDTGAR